ncbi:hypothetical protein P5F04_16460, partial [Clostridium perfringens]|nr:hypothetical protein [Clostridium perfringens]
TLQPTTSIELGATSFFVPYFTSTSSTMSTEPTDESDLLPSSTPGYKPGAAKSADEYAKLDAEDESLARWKASLGIVPGAATGAADGPRVTVLSLELYSDTLPA